MKRLLFLAIPFLLIQAAVADDQLRNVQSELKSQGFYYGDVNGQESTETTAALRRYQIRNGLEVTGALNQETMHSLGIGGAASKPHSNPPSASASQPPSTAVAPRKPASAENDRTFLQQEEQKHPDSDRPNQAPPPRPADPSVVPPPAPLTAPAGDYPVLYANTPYFNAPREVQQETLRRAQAILTERGFYREAVNGVPGPATEEALLSFQRNVRLPLSGRLDFRTLNELHLLPGRGLSNPPLQPFYPNNADRGNPPQRIYRGIIAN